MSPQSTFQGDVLCYTGRTDRLHAIACGVQTVGIGHVGGLLPLADFLLAPGFQKTLKRIQEKEKEIWIYKSREI